MKEINLIFPGLGYKDVNQAIIYVYDKNDILILKEKTYNGRLSVCLNTNSIYKVNAISKGDEIKAVIYIKDENTYVIPLKNSYVCGRTITFLLTDYNYTNLPIERGTIIIWQKQ